ncbi:MAG: 50S ribosomal protein L1 [Planctomycetota bacterium]|nr:50S ribosomal protein L1 [Planctomycetota bacterium]
MGRKHGKRYKSDIEKVPSGPVSIDEAVGLLKQFDGTKFDQTVELVVWLGIDPKQADQAIRGATSLPNGIGKTRRVVAFCSDDEAQAALDAGAIEVGGDDLIAKVQKGWMDFDVAIATGAMMRGVSRLGRILGPVGKMPSPKAGTVVDDVVSAVKEYAAGKIKFRNDDGGNIHAPVGKISFDSEKLVENIKAFLSHLKAMKPASSKGTYIKKACLSATMSPAVELSV